MGHRLSASPGMESAAQVIDSLFSLLGTLAIPPAVALIGWYFQEKQQRFAEERQAWNTMPPISHTNTMNVLPSSD